MNLVEFIITVLLSANFGFVVGAWWATRKSHIEYITLGDSDNE